MAAAAAAPAAFAQGQLASRPMTDVELKKVLDVMAAAGAVRQIGVEITTMLGAGPEGAPMACVMLRYDDGKESHAFAKLQDSRGYLISFRDKTGASRIYYADNVLHLVSALDESKDQSLALTPNAVAQAGFDAELTYWAGKADANFP